MDHLPVSQVHPDMRDKIGGAVCALKKDNVPWHLHPPGYGRRAVIYPLGGGAGQGINPTFPINPGYKGRTIKGIWAVCAVHIRYAQVPPRLCVQDRKLFRGQGRTRWAVIPPGEMMIGQRKKERV